MLLVKTYLGKSRIHGLGVLAGEFIAKGTRIWRYVEGFDRCYTAKQFARLPKAAKDFIRHHGYRVDGEILLTMDNDRHMNHSEDANTYLRDGYAVARRDIRKGEEITNDYREFDATFCAAFLKPKARWEKRNGPGRRTRGR
jgi:SET domain-containing protein